MQLFEMHNSKQKSRKNNDRLTENGMNEVMNIAYYMVIICLN